jgi:hypothetical protein
MSKYLSTVMAKQQSQGRWTPEEVHDSHGRVKQSICRVTIAASPGAGFICVLDRFKATDKITSIKWQMTVNSANIDEVDIGLYTAAVDWSTTEGAIVNLDCYCDDVDLDTAIVVPVEILGFGIATSAADLLTKTLWEAAGVGAAPVPGTEYDLCATIIGDPATITELIFIVQYMVGD